MCAIIPLHEDWVRSASQAFNGIFLILSSCCWRYRAREPKWWASNTVQSSVPGDPTAVTPERSDLCFRNHSDSTLVITGHPSASQWSSKSCDWAGECSRVAQYWHFLDSMWGFECLQSHNKFIDGLRPGPGHQVVLEKWWKGKKSSKDKDFEVCVWICAAVTAAIVCCHHWSGDLFLVGLSYACLLQNHVNVAPLSSGLLKKKTHRYNCSYFGHKKKKIQKRAKFSNYHKHEHNLYSVSNIWNYWDLLICWSLQKYHIGHVCLDYLGQTGTLPFCPEVLLLAISQ